MERYRPQPEKTPRQFGLESQLLWKRAESLDGEIAQRQEFAQQLFQEIERMRLEQGRLDHDQTNQQEAQYWKLQNELQQLEAQRGLIQQALLEIEEQTFDPKKYAELLRELAQPYLPPPDEQPSKRRQAIEKDRTWYEKRGLSVPEDLLHPSADATRLGSGRNAKRLTGDDVSPLHDPEQAFFRATTDTHGGKVRRPGKTGDSFGTPSGRRHRKR